MYPVIQEQIAFPWLLTTQLVNSPHGEGLQGSIISGAGGGAMNLNSDEDSIQKIMTYWLFCGIVRMGHQKTLYYKHISEYDF